MPRSWHFQGPCYFEPQSTSWPASITERWRRAKEAVVVDLLDEEICDISAGYEA
jgi:hypothetical protein